MQPDATYRPGEDVIVKEVGEELVLLDLKKEVYYGLDPVGARMWALLTGGAAVAAALDALLEEYDVTREQLERDMERLIAELEGSGLLRQA